MKHWLSAMSGTYLLHPSGNENWLQWRGRKPHLELMGEDLTNEDDPVAIPCAAYEQMAGRWDPIDHCLGGYETVMAHTERYMPPRPFEDTKAYERRLTRASFTPWFQRLCNAVVSTVTRKPFGWSAALPPEVVSQLDDLDLSGNDLEAVARQALFLATAYGHCGIFVSYPTVPEGLTLAQERALGLRPWWNVIHPRNVIGWRHELATIKGPNGDTRYGRVLSQLRIRNRSMVPDGDFGERVEHTIQVYERRSDEKLGNDSATVTYRTYVKVKEEKTNRMIWVPDEARSGTLSLNYIPFTVLYGQRVDNLVSRPLMLDLAYLNLRHFQLQSDLDHALHLAANPQLTLTGVNLSGGEQVNVGVDEALLFENSDGKAAWIGAPTDGFDAQQQRLTEVEMQMTKLGLAPMVPIKNLPESGISKMIEKQQGGNLLKALVRELERAVNEALYYHSEYLGTPLPSVGLPASFDALALTSQDLLAYSTLQANGQITLSTLLSLLKEGELLPERFDVDEEVKTLEEQLQQQIAAMGTPSSDFGNFDQVGAARTNPSEANRQQKKAVKEQANAAYPDATADKSTKSKA